MSDWHDSLFLQYELQVDIWPFFLTTYLSYNIIVSPFSFENQKKSWDSLNKGTKLHSKQM